MDEVDDRKWLWRLHHSKIVYFSFFQGARANSSRSRIKPICLIHRLNRISACFPCQPINCSWLRPPLEISQNPPLEITTYETQHNDSKSLHNLSKADVLASKFSLYCIEQQMSNTRRKTYASCMNFMFQLLLKLSKPY